MVTNDTNANTVRTIFADAGSFDEWEKRWRERLAVNGRDHGCRKTVMRNANSFLIPSYHRVEEAIAAATNNGDFSVFERLMSVLSQPFTDNPDHATYANSPRSDQIAHRTFCGT